ncbi:MAG: NUDIX domain-containing protein [Pseudomonadota bacterium]
MSDVPEAACGAAILNEAGELLLIQRLRPPEPGHWGLPGGKIDFGEPAETAVKREIAEELGIEIALTGLACLTETIGADDGRHWVAPVYGARIMSGAPGIQEPEKHGGWGWFALNALPAPLTTPTRQYLQSVRSD